MIELLDILKLSIPVSLAFIGWLFNESRKSYWQRRERKETQYIALLESLKGFYDHASPATAKNDKEEFLKQQSVGWLYCPDSIIRKINIFLDHVSHGTNKSDDENKQAVGEIVLLMRKDLLGMKFRLWDRTRLKASDYRHFKANSIGNTPNVS